LPSNGKIYIYGKVFIQIIYLSHNGKKMKCGIFFRKYSKKISFNHLIKL